MPIFIADTVKKEAEANAVLLSMTQPPHPEGTGTISFCLTRCTDPVVPRLAHRFYPTGSSGWEIAGTLRIRDVRCIHATEISVDLPNSSSEAISLDISMTRRKGRYCLLLHFCFFKISFFQRSLSEDFPSFPSYRRCRLYRRFSKASGF